jgi:hypothetical protein
MGKTEKADKGDKKARKEKRKSEALASLPVDSALIEDKPKEGDVEMSEAQGVEIVVKVLISASRYSGRVAEVISFP